MKGLTALFEECKKELDAIGIKYGNISTVEINTRAKKRWGLCKKLSDGTYKISISDRALKDDVDDIKTKEIIIHEILHSCPDCLNHGPEWKSLAYKVKQAYGYNIQRLLKAEEYNAEAYKKPPAKFKLTCKSCGRSFTYCKTTKVVKNFRRYRCSACYGELSLERL